MALAKKNSNSSRVIVVSLVIVMVAVVGYVLFREFFLKTGGVNDNTGTSNRDQAVISNFGEAILNDPRFTTLKPTNIDITADANRDGGQPNPFH